MTTTTTTTSMRMVMSMSRMTRVITTSSPIQQKTLVSKRTRLLDDRFALLPWNRNLTIQINTKHTTTTTTTRGSCRSNGQVQQRCKSSSSSSSSSPEEEAQRRAYQYYQEKNQSNMSWFSRRFGRRSKQQDRLSREERSVQMAWYAAAAVMGALGATYASVPLYKMFCQATGFGGTTQRVTLQEWASQTQERQDTGISRILQNVVKYVLDQFPSRTLPWTGTNNKNKVGGNVHTWTDEEAAAKLASLKPVTNGKLITVRFDSTVGDVLPWTFVPTQLDVKVVPGETALSFFTVHNKSKDKAITGVATYNVHPPKAGLYFNKIQCFCFEEQRLLPGETVDMPVFFFIDPDFESDPALTHVNNITLSYTFFQTDQDDDDDDDDDDEEEK